MMSPDMQDHKQSARKTKGRRRSRAGGRLSQLGLTQDDNSLSSPQTPVGRLLSQRSLESYSPLTFASSQSSPWPAQPASPSVILFKGPAGKGFERIHDDGFPQSLNTLQSMARSKFKLAPSASVQMSYVNPDGDVCDLDDEQDLRAFAAHAAVSQKLKVNVTTSDTTVGSQFSEASQPSVNRIASMQPPASPSKAHQAATHSQHSLDPIASPSPPSASTLVSERKAISVLPSPESMQQSTFSSIDVDASASAPESSRNAAVPQPTSSKRKRAQDSPPRASAAIQPPSSPAAPAAKKPRRRTEKSAASAAANVQVDAASVQVSAAPAAPEQASDETPQRAKVGRPKKTVAAAPAAPAQASMPPEADAASQATESIQAPSQNDSQPTLMASQPAVTAKPRGRPPKKSLATVEVDVQPVAIAASPSSEVVPGTIPGPVTVAASETAAPASKPRGRPTKSTVSDQTPADPPLAAEPLPSVTEALTQTTETNDSVAPTEMSSASPTKPRGRPKKSLQNTEPASEAAEADAPPSQQPTTSDAPAPKRRGRPPKSSQVPTETATEEATIASQLPATTSTQETAEAEPSASPVVAKRRGRPPKKSLALAEAGPEAAAIPESQEEVAAEPPTKKRATRATKAAPAAQDTNAAAQTALTTEASAAVSETPAEVAVAKEPTPTPASQPSDTPASLADPIPARGAAASKARAATKRTEAAADEAESCVVCGKSPNHDREECDIFKAGPQAIIELMAKIRFKARKSKQDKEAQRVLMQWSLAQLDGGQDDAGATQESTQPSQAAVESAPKTSQQQVVSSQAAANGVETQPESAAAKKGVRATSAAAKRQAAKKDAATTAAAAAVESNLPPPSGIEASRPESGKPAAKAKVTRKQANQATIAAAAAEEPEPQIALTPSSPMPTSATQSSSQNVVGLRAPSESSSEAELATSPMLSAAPRDGEDDMDVDPLPATTSAAQQLEERKKGMNMVEAEVGSPSKMTLREVVEASKTTGRRGRRSRSASVTSSDTSDGADSSDEDESDSDTDHETTLAAVQKDEVEAAKTADAAEASEAGADADAAGMDEEDDPIASDEDSSSASSESGTESGSDQSSSSESESEASRDAPTTATRSTKVQAAEPRRAAGGGNPFLRGISPQTLVQSAPSSVQKSTPFTRLSDLKPSTLRQNMSQPGSPLSTGGSTPVNGSATGFFPSQSVPNKGRTIVEESDESESDESDSSASSSSSEDEAPKGARGKRVVPAAKRAGASAPQHQKKRKTLFSVFG